MSDNEGKRRRRETIADRNLGDVGGSDDFGVKVRHGLAEVGDRDDSSVPLSHQNRNDLTGAAVQQVDSVGGHGVEDTIDLCGTFFGDVPFRQRAGVQIEGIRHAYSSRMAMMPWLNSLPSGSMPSWIIRARSFLAPIGLPRMPSCFMNFFQPATNSACPSRAARMSCSPRASSSLLGSGRRAAGLPCRCWLTFRRVAIVASLVRFTL